jgi:hypothetical protein
MDRLGPDELERLIKLLGMLGSAHDGERAAAGLKAHELVRRHGLTWSDVLLAAPQTPATPPRLGWREKLRICTAQQHRLSSWERTFVQSLTRWRGTPTEKQLAKLEHIYENLS